MKQQHHSLMQISTRKKDTRGLFPSIVAFFLTLLLLSLSRQKAPFDILILDRLVLGLGWAEIALLSTYAAWLTPTMISPASARIWRPRIWRLFTVVFFGQLILGLLGFDIFLMTGNLHLPIPALIAAAPLYRGEGFFMLILFFSTLILVGPAWCSHLCYVGAFDDWAAQRIKRPKPLPAVRPLIRAFMTFLVLGLALGLNLLGEPPEVAFFLALGFGLSSVLVMLIFSRRNGHLVHCTAFCPMGLIATLTGRLNPFRMKIGSGCTECRACERACRYDALSLVDIQNRHPSLSCTLCGDCVSACRHAQIGIHFFGLKPETARSVFYVLVVSLHATFLGVARM